MSSEDNSVRIQAERFADNIIGEINSSFPGLSGIKERLIANASKELEQMAIALVEKGFPDIRVDEGNWAAIATKVNADPSAGVGEIFQAALNHHRMESAARTKKIVEEHVESLRNQPNAIEAFLEGGDWYIELAKRNIGDSRIYWRFLYGICDEVGKAVADNVAAAVFQWRKSCEADRITQWPELYGWIKVQSQKSPWLVRYHNEYDKLPPLETLPESVRHAEYQRREAIRHELLSLPGAPKTIVLSAIERIKEQFQTHLGVASFRKKPFPDNERLYDWVESDFDQDTVPDFEDPALNLLSNDLRIAHTRELVPIESGIKNSKPKHLVEFLDGLSPDGLTLRWGGSIYQLSPTSARLVKLLFDSFKNGFPFLHEEYLKTEGEFESDVRHIVRDSGLESLIVREVDSNGKQVKGKWGLAGPKEIPLPH